MGWIGMKRDMLHYLDMVSADKNAEGAYLIDGRGVISGLDGQEVVVPDETRYFVDGKPKMLAAGLRTTSAGVGVKVF